MRIRKRWGQEPGGPQEEIAAAAFSVISSFITSSRMRCRAGPVAIFRLRVGSVSVMGMLRQSTIPKLRNCRASVGNGESVRPLR